MTFRAILPLLALLALLATPLRMFAGEAAAMPHHGGAAIPHHGPAAVSPEHCPPPAEVPDERAPAGGIDCMMACAAMAAAGAEEAGPGHPPGSAYAPSNSPIFAGTAPGSDPPPPRRA